MTDPSDDLDAELPRQLQRDLRALLGPRVAMPDAIGTALRAAARRRRFAPLRPLLAAVAAALLLALPLLFVLQQRAGSGGPLAREDFDRSGRVDVLDAYRLALALAKDQSVDPAFDLDGDGRVDRRDVDLIAARAVAIRG